MKMSLLPEEVCKELEYSVEKNLKQNCLSFSVLSGNSLGYSFIKPPTSHFQKFTDYILIRLSKPSILQKLVISRHRGEVVCNLKSFQVHTGLSENGCQMLLEGNLKSDSQTEVFMLRNKINGILAPCLYIKIMPLQYWDSCTKFDVSSSVSLFGCDDERLIDSGLKSRQQHQHIVATQLCLKFLRDAGQMEAFEVVSRTLGVSIEHPIVAELYHHLVKLGDYKKTETLLEEAFIKGFCNDYLANQQCIAQWQEITQQVNDSDWPASRGGHQICVDPNNGSFYLLGGWNGLCDLSDFWKFDIQTRLWTCISSDTSTQGGPTARSCHKMCIDLRNQKLFTIGKYLEHHKRIPENLKSDFYRYDIVSNEWTCLSQDTSSDGGPPLVFDHQVAIDDDRGIIYIFGGNTLISTIVSEERPTNHQSMSSLYRYSISDKNWCLIDMSDPVLSPRIGHSLLYHSHLKYLFIFAGQQNRQSINDLQVFDTTNLDNIKHLDYLSVKDFLPAPLVGFTHRSTLDTGLNEIHILTGINKDTTSDKQRDVRQNSLWIYSITRGTWQCIYSDDNTKNQAPLSHPLPRFAHQFVYDCSNKVHFLFGGNPNQDCSSETRLSDLWSLKLSRMDGTKLLKDMQYMVRKYCYKEMVNLDATKALKYLQNDLYDSINLSDHEQLCEFETLPSLLFRSYMLDMEVTAPSPTSSSMMQEIRENRMELFELISKFFPDDAKQPSTNLIDLVPHKPWDPLCAIGSLDGGK